ncbi:MAG TPA: phosphate acyltransferase PlsX [Puia sp.]|jgi:glycerol-3-phosphate acyltransferase PlsX|nr:phosphate acyltransferase PlsX [Puia sp.]
MNIALDMMGGDFAPDELVKGVRDYISEKTPAELTLIGDEQQIKSLLSQHQVPANSYKIVPSTEVIGMNEHPLKALKGKPNSSIAIGFELLASGKTDAFISAGNTGAMLIGSLYTIKPIDGILRPTIGTIIPMENGSTGLLLDVGANADCKAEHLNQFATLGSLYAKYILGIEKPRVGLINIGEEEGKGNVLAQTTYPLLKENNQIQFIGNVEGRDVFLDHADVLVCEGFTGNVILKLAESLHGIMDRQKIQNKYFDRFNFEDYGGTPVLGVNKPVIIGHGISRAKAYKNMLLLAQKMIETKLLEKMASAFQA